MDFPIGCYGKSVVSSAGEYALRSSLGMQAATTWGAGNWVANNRAYFVPFVLRMPYEVKKLWWANGGSISGNLDVGVYSMQGTRIVSSGSVAQASSNVVQATTLSPSIILSPGAYMMALACSTTGASVHRAGNVLVRETTMMGYYQMDSAMPLPATVTYAIVPDQFFPLFGIARGPII